MYKITGVSAVKNEEDKIAGMIEDLQEICNQIIIIDGQSTDNTVAIAESMGCEVYEGDNLQYGEYARRLALPYAKNDYILILDADERITPYLLSIAEELCSGKYKGAQLQEQMIIAGQPRYTEWRYRFSHKDHVSFVDALHSSPMPEDVLPDDMYITDQVCIEHKKTWSEIIRAEEIYEEKAVTLNRPEILKLNFHLNKLKELDSSIYDILVNRV